MNDLFEEFERQKEGFNDHFRLKIYRALSWLKKASKTEQEDKDMWFLSLWIAFNAVYAKNIQFSSPADRIHLREYLELICRLDHEKALYQLIWKDYPGAIRLLLANKFCFQPFWDFQNKQISEEQWFQDFERANHKVKTALETMDTATLLACIFERLYTLRNQLVHGGASHGSSMNRSQLNDSCKILNDLLPVMLRIMMSNAANESWGLPFYPVIKEE